MSPRIATFDWDEGNLRHIALHDVTAAEVQKAVMDRFCVLETSEVRQGQLRYNVTGETVDGRILTVIFEIRRGAIRPVTAFTAPKKKQSNYWARRNHVNKAPLS
jgi:uncharacterized protein